jgi:hypothetical protein
MLSACSGTTSHITGPQPTLTFSATPAAVFTGQYVTFTWDAVNANSCTASGSWSGVGPASGSQQIQIAAPGNYTFTLTCTGSGGSASGSAAVAVTTAGSLPVTLSANPTSVKVGLSTPLLGLPAAPTRALHLAPGLAILLRLARRQLPFLPLAAMCTTSVAVTRPLSARHKLTYKGRLPPLI